MDKRSDQIASLTGARSFAAFHVLLLHSPLTLLPPPDLLMPFVRRGESGVSSFFVPSGLVPTYRYVGTFSQGALPLPLRRFYVARAARIYPTQLLTLAAFTVQSWLE